MLLARIISEERRKRKTSLRQFARETGINYTTLRRFESDDCDSITVALQLINWLLKQK